MKKALIIGGSGFVGGYLYRCLVARGYDVTVTKLPHETAAARAVNVDITDRAALREVLCSLRPDCIFHLAAQSSVKVSWDKPALTVDINVQGALNLLESVREFATRPRVLLIGSSEEYGVPEKNPVTEEQACHPGNIYAATKACQNMLGAIYAKAYGMNVIMTRAFNHIGPGQSPQFVAADFCKQAAEIEAGLREPIIYTGNLAAKRDFTDVRDVAEAYAALMEKGVAAETYNVGSGKTITIREILTIILQNANVAIRVESDPSRMRPLDVPEIRADIGKLTAATGWRPAYDIKDTLRATLEDWRKVIRDTREGK